MSILWSGVFPALMTEFNKDGSLDLDGLQRHITSCQSAGIEGLVGTSRPLQEEALGVTRQQAERFTPETAQAYMSPYQRAVTDIEKREAGRQFDVAQQARDAAAVGAGGESFMGSRAAILEAEAARNQQQLLADIEARGLQSAFTNAQQQFAAQKARENSS